MEKGAREENSLYDFIYVDHPRVALYLSQLSQHGKLKGVTRSTRTVDRDKSGYGVQGYVEFGAESSAEKSLESQFDPHWKLPLILLDQLDVHGYIQRQISAATLGEIVLVKGDLSIVDLTMVKEFWSQPAIKRLFLKLAEKDPNLASQNKEYLKGSGFGIGDVVLQLLQLLPHTIQAVLSGESGRTWFTLRPEGMVIPQADIILKHGLVVPGVWHALGILDARPDAENALQTNSSPIPSSVAEMAKGIAEGATSPTLTGLAQMFSSIAPMAKKMMGRPTDAYGITPVALFRAVVLQIPTPPPVPDAAP